MDRDGYAVNLYRMEGYKDRMAHRPGRPNNMRPQEQAAYDAGARDAERAMGFRDFSTATPATSSTS